MQDNYVELNLNHFLGLVIYLGMNH